MPSGAARVLRLTVYACVERTVSTRRSRFAEYGGFWPPGHVAGVCRGVIEPRRWPGRRQFASVKCQPAGAARRSAGSRPHRRLPGTQGDEPQEDRRPLARPNSGACCWCCSAEGSGGRSGRCRFRRRRRPSIAILRRHVSASVAGAAGGGVQSPFAVTNAARAGRMWIWSSTRDATTSALRPGR